MSKAVQECIINVWNLWVKKQPNVSVWFHAFRLMVQQACRYCKDGWTDEQVIRCIRYTREDASAAIACNDFAGEFFTE